MSHTHHAHTNRHGNTAQGATAATHTEDVTTDSAATVAAAETPETTAADTQNTANTTAAAPATAAPAPNTADTGAPHTAPEPLLNPSAERGDPLDISLRPQSLHDFIGQQQVLDNLRVFIDASKERKDTLDHVLLSGPPGLGKTTLAAIIANELACTCRVTSAPAIEKPKDIAGLLSSQADNILLFIDEIHRLRGAIEEMLYTAMEDNRIDLVIGQGPTARTIGIPLSPFTLVGATTRPGGLSAPLSSRFGIHLRIDYYPQHELSAIIKRSAALLNIDIDDDASALLAQSSRGTPRIANRLVRRIRDFAQVSGTATVTPDIARYGLSQLGIDAQGLGRQDRAILQLLAQTHAGKAVGLKTISIAVGESTDTIEEYYEPYLIRQGLLARTPQGRVATDKAYVALNIKPAGRLL